MAKKQEEEKQQSTGQGRQQGAAQGAGSGRKVELSAQQVMQLYENESARFETLNNQRMSLARMIIEVETAVAAIDSVERGAENEKAMVSLGAGVYLDTAVADSKSVSMSKPGGVVMKLGTKEAREELLKRKEGLDKTLQAVVDEQAKVGNNVNMWAKIMAEGRRAAAERARQGRGPGSG